MWQGWVNFILGAWLIVSGFIFPLQGRLNMIIVGVLVIIFGFSGISWQGIINGILGIWILVCGIFIGTLAVAQWNYIATGIVVLILGFWRGVSRRKKPPVQPVQ
jgi:hypothetical protein